MVQEMKREGERVVQQASTLERQAAELLNISIDDDAVPTFSDDPRGEVSNVITFPTTFSPRGTVVGKLADGRPNEGRLLTAQCAGEHFH
jgi:hypothetical protein